MAKKKAAKKKAGKAKAKKLSVKKRTVKDLDARKAKSPKGGATALSSTARPGLNRMLDDAVAEPGGTD